MITVTSNADSGAGTLRAAIAAAALGETITFAGGITNIVLTTGQLTISQNVIITGPGSAILTIDGNANSRIFNVTAGASTISGITVTNGLATTGGAIQNANTLTLSDVIIKNSHATSNGGGLYNTNTVTMTNCSVTGCVSDADGGGIWNGNTITATNLIISGCTGAVNGGGVLTNGTFRQTGGNVSANSCTSQFGAGFFNNGTLEITEITVDSNVSGAGNGAGVHNTNTTKITRCTISTNHDIALYNDGGTYEIDNSTVSGNLGPAISQVNSGVVAITHSTVTKNLYGLIQDSGCVCEIQNTILTGNTTDDIESDTGDFISDGYNLLGVTLNPLTPGTGDQTVLTFAAAGMGLLADNGGPTFTHALIDLSPAIDAGTNVAAPATDQRGTGFPRVQGGKIDIGAYEKLPPPPICLNVNAPLPGWLTQSGNCLSVTPGAFRGATKAAANAAAQAAIDAFVQSSTDCNGPNPCVTPGPDTTVSVPSSGGQFMQAFIPTTNSIWIADKFSNQVTVIDVATNGVTTFPVFGASSIDGIKYGSGQDKVYLSCGTAGNNKLVVYNTNKTFDTDYTTAFDGSSVANIDYDAQNDRIIMINADTAYVIHSGGINVEIVGCAGLTTLFSGNLGTIGWWPAYVSSTNTYYVTTQASASKLWKIDGVTFTRTLSNLTARSGISIWYVEEKDLLFTADTGPQLVCITPGATDVTFQAFPDEYWKIEGTCVNPCTNEIQIAIQQWGLLCLNFDTLATVRLLTLGDLNLQSPKYVLGINQTYVLDMGTDTDYVVA